jgi:transposase-like protein
MPTPIAKRDKQTVLADTYAKKLEPLVEDAKRAYGSRDQNKTPHKASRRYTELLVEYYEKGGSIQMIADRLGVTYAGIRRRIITANNAVPPAVRRKGLTEEVINAHIDRIRDAKERGTERYYAAIAQARENGVSMSAIARGLGISNASPLYYGLQQHYTRRASK